MSSDKIHCFEFGNFRLDLTNRELMKNGKHLPLTQKSFELLAFLIENRDRSLRKNEILNSIWDENFVEEANLAQHIYMIRKVLKNTGNTEEYIETIPKYGYRFVGSVTENFIENPGSLIHTSNENEIPVETNGFKKHEIEVAEAFQQIIGVEPDPVPTAPIVRITKDSSFLLTIVGLITVTALAAGYFFFSSQNGVTDPAEISTIAILPFTQIGEEKDEKLGLGMADTLISRLGSQDRVSISPTSTVVKFIEEGRGNPIEIGEELNVDAVLTGTIQREDGNVRVTVQLISVADKSPIWSDKFDAVFSNMFTLQDNISEKVAEKLSLKLNEPKSALSREDEAAKFESALLFRNSFTARPDSY
ncbi:MAG: hypothetical protein HKN25_13675 [Pyrinomonadaceae bacterium]|nr:hypothetical protein [Pyrinomonadaceae bacterium]